MLKKKIIFKNVAPTLGIRTMKGSLTGAMLGLIIGLIEAETIYIGLRGFNESLLIFLFAPLVYIAFFLVIGAVTGIVYHLGFNLLRADEKVADCINILVLINLGIGAFMVFLIANDSIVFERFHPVSISADLVILAVAYLLWQKIPSLIYKLKFIKYKVYIALVIVVIGIFAVYNYKIFKSYDTPPAPAEKHLQKMDRSNVIVLMIDTLRADHVGSYGYQKDVTPTIDKLAENGIIFENAWASSSWTIPSHFSLMTGVTAGAIQQEFSISPSSLTIPERLHMLGYRTALMSANPLLSEAVNFHPGFQLFDNEVNIRNRMNNLKVFDLLAKLKFKRPIRGNKIKLHNDAKLMTDCALDYMEANSGDPYFLFINYMDVHDPYMPPDKYKKMFSKHYTGKYTGDICGELSEAEFIKQEVHKMKREDWDHILSQYDGTIRYVDDQIKRIVKYLENKNQLENTILIVLSDHGELFGEYGLATHHLTLSEEETHIPLIIHYPSKIKNSARVKTIARIIDIYPTLQSLIGFKMNEKIYIEGKPLIDSQGNPTNGADYAAATLYENNYKATLLGEAFRRNLFSYRTMEWKYLHPDRNKSINWDNLPEGLFRKEQAEERLYKIKENQELVLQEKEGVDDLISLFNRLIKNWKKSIKQKHHFGSKEESEEYKLKMLITGYNQPY